IKKLMGLKPQETGSLQIVLKYPKTAVKQADKLHAALTPNVAAIAGEIQRTSGDINICMLSFKRDAISLAILTKNIIIQEKDVIFPAKEQVFISAKLAKENQLKAGDSITINYITKFDPQNVTRNYKLTGTFSSRYLPDNTVLFSDDVFFKYYYEDLPPDNKIFIISESHPLYAALGKEWERLARSRTTKEMTKKMKDLANYKGGSAALDVRTMYETAESIIKLEKALNIITLAAVLILFFIILIGVVNTLRMTIRERTREIGTVRAIGMQKNDVRNSFILETFLLTLISTIIGTLLAFLIMDLLGKITIHSDSFMSILLVDKHINFVPKLTAIIFNMLLIIFIAVATAFFPAHRASRLPCAKALSHFE
ncbi:MAG: FtsX-like permease family protein, partial [Candidatus Margulisbacteria bacterium]|nr:FtsX-like permease family protein [Candidatus Margulisiibacteriota bacterium]